MDLVTLAAQAVGGIIAAVVAGALLRRLSVGLTGALIVGSVGGTCAGLIAVSYGLGPAALADGTLAPAGAVIAQMAAGAAGGALLAILTGLLQSLVERSESGR